MRAGRSLSFYLGLLGLSILLPALAVMAALLWNVAVLDDARADREALQLARSVTADLDREIDGSIQTLLVLGTSAALRNGDLAAFHRQARESLAWRKLNMLVRNADGLQIVNTRVDWGTALPETPQSESDRIVVRTRKPHVTDLVIGAVARRWVVGISVPVVIDNSVVFVLTMSVSPEQIREYFLDGRMDAGWNIAVSDKRRIIARALDHEEFVGREVSPDVAAQTVGDEGVHRVVNLGGQRVVRGWKRLERADWVVAAFVPTEVLDAPFKRMWAMFGVASTLLLALSVPLSIWLSHRIAAPINEIATLAAGIGRGDPVAPIRTPLQEANIVAETLAATAAGLRERTALLSESEARYRSVFDQAAVGVEQVALDGRLLAVNERLCAMLGYSQDQGREKTFAALVLTVAEHGA
jgi:two-component system, sensor histidine kinase